MRSLQRSSLMALAALTLVLMAAAAQAQSHEGHDGHGGGGHDGHGGGGAQHAAMGKAQGAEKGWKEERHWAADGCDRHMGGVMEKHIEGCHTCISVTKGVGDPTRCPQCLKVHGHHPMPEVIVNQCLACVPKMEGKKLGWACAQYCAHHGIIANEEEGKDCNACLESEFPHDKWFCHVCMEQVMGNDPARKDCYSCIQDGQNAYECASCARVKDPKDRDDCFTCMKKGTPGKSCALRYGVGDFVNPSVKMSRASVELFKKAGIKVPDGMMADE